MIRKRTTEEIEIIFDFLKIDFEQGDEAADDSSKGRELVDMILWRERVRHGVENAPKLWPPLDTQTIKKMQSWGAEEFELIISMAVFRKLATGNTESAIRTLKNAITYRSIELSKTQTGIAKKPRPERKHPLSTMVESIVSKHPIIKVNNLLKALQEISRNNKLSPCFYDISKLAFIPSDSKYPTIPKESLRNYLYRAKKKIKAR
jgi:hypothetical protein